jgi:uncharacterized protein YecE (DUF72 family)
VPDTDRIRVGISSWLDRALLASGTFYPRKSMNAEARLRFYASAFDTVEVNSSFYAIPDVRNAHLWVTRTPANFLFHVKAYSLLTGHHPQAAALPAELQAGLAANAKKTRRGAIDASSFSAEAIEEAFRLFRTALTPLAQAGKLGYVLFQLAPWIRFSHAQLDYVTSLPGRLPGWTIAVEFRDRSWYAAASATLPALRTAGVAHVVVDAPQTPNAVPRVTTATAPAAVFRLHGRNADGWLRQLQGKEPTVQEKYDYLYSGEELQELLPEIRALMEEAGQVDVVFNNNNRDYPVTNALQLRRLLGQRTPDVEELRAAYVRGG